MKTLVTSIFALSLIASSHAATVFITNNSAKTLASNEGDAGTGYTNFIDGLSGEPNDGLDGDSTGDSTVLTLSADDGGGAITLTTVNTSGNTDLSMDGNSIGHGNDKWGASQNWTFNFDQTISFDGLGFNTPPGTQPMVLRSAAWKDDSAASGTGWSFSSNGTLGTFDLSGTSNFTAAGVSNVAAGTSIEFGYFQTTTGGTELSSFQISVVPEPSAFALLAGCFGLAWIMVRRR